MKLIYISSANLRDKNFVINLVHNFKPEQRVLLLHDHFGSLSDTRFVTKRISALLSESLVVNNSFSGDQRNILVENAGSVSVKSDFLLPLFQHVQLVILNPIGISDGEAKALDSLKVLSSLRQNIQPGELIFFPSNLLSPLSMERKSITDESIYRRLLDAFEEEKEALDRALAFAPASIASPVNFLM